MNNFVASFGVLGGIVFGIASGMYFLMSAKSLPSFMPGFDATMTLSHYDYGAVTLLLAVASFVFASFQSGQQMSN